MPFAPSLLGGLFDGHVLPGNPTSPPVCFTLHVCIPSRRSIQPSPRHEAATAHNGPNDYPIRPLPTAARPLCAYMDGPILLFEAGALAPNWFCACSTTFASPSRREAERLHH
eukprot:scaffold243025_cov33-Tisochrysis_lutea.AAC.2